MATRIKNLTKASSLQATDCFAIDSTDKTRCITASTMKSFFNSSTLFKNYNLTWLIGSELYLQIGPLQLNKLSNNQYEVTGKIADKNRTQEVGWLKCNNNVPISLSTKLNTFDKFMLIFADEVGDNRDNDTQMIYQTFDVGMYDFIYKQQRKRNQLFALGNGLKNTTQTISAGNIEYSVKYGATAYATHNYGNAVYYPCNYSWANNSTQGTAERIVFYDDNVSDYMKNLAFTVNTMNYLVAAVGMKLK